MPTATILAHLGLFVRRAFMSPESCRLIRSEMVSADRVPAMVRRGGETSTALDQATRRTSVARVSASTAALVEERLRAIMPALADHFLVQLTGWQQLGFYIYEEGDFFLMHRDRDDGDPTTPDWIRARRVSVSILLNDERGGVDGHAYRGGALVFHGHRGDRGGTGFEIPLEGEEGMLVAFPSDWMHQVQPVMSGRRFSIVTWFF